MKVIAPTRPLWVLALCASLLYSGIAVSQPPAPGRPRAVQAGLGSLRFLSGVAVLPCSQQIGGVSPFSCMDFVNNTFTDALTIDTGTRSAAGVTCTGSGTERWTGTGYPGNTLYTVDADYPSDTGGQHKYSFDPVFSGAVFLRIREYNSTITVVTNGTASSSRTGSVKVAAYWNGTEWRVSFQGDPAISAGSGAPPASDTYQVYACNSSNQNEPLNQTLRSVRIYNLGTNTLTDAQIQAAAT